MRIFKFLPSNKSLALLFFLLTFSIFSFGEINYGLNFKSYNEDKDNRTNLNLTPQNSFLLKDYFSIEFKVKFKDEKPFYGYVVRIVIDKSKSIDIVLNTKDVLNLVAGDDISYFFPKSTKIFNPIQWNKIRIELFPLKNSLRFSVNGKGKGFSYDLKSCSKVDAYFGANIEPKFSTFDVPRMCLKDVAVYDVPEHKKYFWKLERHGLDGVYDSIQHVFASAKSPDWIIDQRIKWHKESSFQFSSIAYPIFDGRDKIYFVSRDKLGKYSIQNKNYSTNSFSPHLPIDSITNQFLYDENQNQIIYYDFENKAVSYLDLVHYKWSNPILRKDLSGYLKHNSFISPIDHSVVQLFGYGFHTYKSEKHSFVRTTGKWNKETFKDKISPRYLSSIAIEDSTLYIYGGIGNKSGKQENGINVRNDFYAVNLKDNSVKSIWNIDNPEHGEVASSSLIINKEKGLFYALCFQPNKYKSYLVLNQFGLVKPNRKVLADTIPYFFQDTESSSDLYLSKETSQLICVTVHKVKPGKFEAQIYSLAYPPLIASEIFQSKSTFWSWFWGVVGFFIVAISMAVFMLIRKRSQIVNKAPILSTDSDDEFLQNIIIPLPLKELKEGVYFLGGFQVINKDGVDVTGEFTPVMKFLLVSIILFTQKSGKGISNVKIKDIIWPDKSEESARNNRSVNLSKIRLILSTLTGFDISNDNSYWTISYGESAFCDYIQTVALLNEAQRNKDISIEHVLHLLSLVSSGELLPNISLDWVDTFKSEYSNLVIDVLLSLKEHENLIHDQRVQFTIANTILVLDTLNEEAIKLKCLALVQMGRIKIAKAEYDTFCKEYKNVMGEDVASSFDQFLKE